MSTPALIKRLTEAVEKASRSANHCASGRMEEVDPELVVKGFGPVEPPLKGAAVKRLLARCKPAPYGKGTKTLVDERVRKTFELDPEEFTLGDAWNAAVEGVARSVAKVLGLPADRLDARLYKLLAYEPGGFFLPHRDSEKHDRMVASLIVALPNPFEGGALVVRHGAVEQRCRFEDAARGEAACYAGFFADCEHEVEEVRGGLRLCLSYNLVLKPIRTAKSRAKTKAKGEDEGEGEAERPNASIDGLVESIAKWTAGQPAEPLVFAMEHHYTERGLSLDLLKGADRPLAVLVEKAAEKAGCLVHLAQVERHLTQWADDGSFERGYRRDWRAAPRDLEIGETYEDELTASHWFDMEGREQPWGEVPLELPAIVSATPINEWKPTTEEFEGYTGNEGNTLDRWYHRSALVVWSRGRHFDVLTAAGAADCMPLFRSMVSKLSKTPKRQIEERRAECVRFARAIVDVWGTTGRYYWRNRETKPAPKPGFSELLLKLHDQETIARFLAKLAGGDREDDSTPLDSLITSACREFGWGAFASELKRLIAPRTNHRGEDVELPKLDTEWLAAFCCDKAEDPDKSALADELCATAAARFCKPRPDRRFHRRRYQDEAASNAEKALPFLLKALTAAGRNDDLARVVRYVEDAPDDFRMDQCLAPSLVEIVPWARKRLGAVPPPLADWLAAVRARLEAAVAAPPPPPSDWKRPAVLSCKCEFCTRIKDFLADPKTEIAVIPAREDRRRHMIQTIRDDRCDLKHHEQRTGSPYSLVLTKTRGSYGRAVDRYKKDLAQLERLRKAAR